MKTINIILLLFLAASISATITPILATNKEISSEINNFKNTQQPKIPDIEKNDAKIPEVKTENKSWSTKKKVAVVVGVIGIVILCAGFIMIPPMMKILKQFEEGETRYFLETEAEYLNQDTIRSIRPIQANQGLYNYQPGADPLAPIQPVQAQNNLMSGLQRFNLFGKIARKGLYEQKS